MSIKLDNPGLIRLVAYCDADTKARVKAACEVESRSESNLVIRAVKWYLDFTEGANNA